MKEARHPTNRITNSSAVNAKPKANNFIRLAPNITGIDIKNESSADSSHEVSSNIPPIIVEPERDVPEMRDYIWNKSTLNASL